MITLMNFIFILRYNYKALLIILKCIIKQCDIRYRVSYIYISKKETKTAVFLYFSPPNMSLGFNLQKS